MSQPPVSDQTSTLTEHGLLDPSGDQGVLCLRWCHPLPALAPFMLGTERCTLGRDPSCDVAFQSGHVSRVHAEIRRAGPVVVIADLASKNGIFVNGKRMPQAVLHAGDVLRIGDQVAVAVSAPPGSELHYGSLATSVSGGYRHRVAVKRARELAVALLPLVLEGATGTGKELMARAVHEWSGRTGPFLAVNSAIYSRTMAAAELFGFKKGAFTGAEQSGLGHVRAAHGGTLFLDEILELSLEVQGMLLRTLEQHEVLPLGETRAVPVDVRFVVATQTPLSDAVAAGRFRADLRARLEGAIVRLPRLAECREIVPELLGDLYARRGAEVPLELAATAVEALCLHGWPLNVRELDMLAGRLALRTEPGRVEVTDLELGPDSPENHGSAMDARTVAPTVPGRRPSGTPYDADELDRLRATLARHAGNVSRAAAELGITRQRAYRMLGLTKPTS